MNSKNVMTSSLIAILLVMLSITVSASPRNSNSVIKPITKLELKEAQFIAQRTQMEAIYQRLLKSQDAKSKSKSFSAK